MSFAKHRMFLSSPTKHGIPFTLYGFPGFFPSDSNPFQLSPRIMMSSLLVATKYTFDGDPLRTTMHATKKDMRTDVVNQGQANKVLRLIPTAKAARQDVMAVIEVTACQQCLFLQAAVRDEGVIDFLSVHLYFFTISGNTPRMAAQLLIIKMMSHMINLE